MLKFFFFFFWIQFNVPFKIISLIETVLDCLIIEPYHNKTNHAACPPSKDMDQHNQTI